MDFERVLRTASCARSDHFAVHFVDAAPAPARFRRSRLSPERQQFELSTGAAPVGDLPVDNSYAAAPAAVVATGVAAVFEAWLGVVVPKRHAKRAVTRSLLKRQMRNAALRRLDASAPPSAAATEAVASAGAEAAALRAGLWVVRLRAPFDRSNYPSAASDALRVAARAELDAVLRRAARKALSPDGGRATGSR